MLCCSQATCLYVSVTIFMQDHMVIACCTDMPETKQSDRGVCSFWCEKPLKVSYIHTMRPTNWWTGTAMGSCLTFLTLRGEIWRIVHMSWKALLPWSQVFPPVPPMAVELGEVHVGLVPMLQRSPMCKGYGPCSLSDRSASMFTLELEGQWRFVTFWSIPLGPQHRNEGMKEWRNGG